MDDSLKYSKIALELDPFSLVIRSTVADTYYDRREYEKAKEMYDYILNLDKNFIRAYLYLSGIYLNQGDCEKTPFELNFVCKFISNLFALSKIVRAVCPYTLKSSPNSFVTFSIDPNFKNSIKSFEPKPSFASIKP